MNQRLLFALFIAAVAGQLAACSSTRYVHIRHPLHVGQVDDNSVPFHAQSQELDRAIPSGTLVDEASLTEVTPERICVHTNLWSLDEVNATRGDYSQYNIALLNDQDGVENTAADIQLETPETAAYNGRIGQQEQVGTRRVCRETRNNSCVQWGTEPVYRTVYYPHVWQVTQHPANMCFPNGGFVTPSTTRLALEMDPRGASNMIFEWQFESAVAGQPAQQQ